MQKRVLAIHDISCVGKCSLTVALPILSAAGLECSVLPTAVLSTHTGGFPGFTYRDLTGDLRPIADHWRSLDLRVDSVYTGYLGSFEQLRIVEDVIAAFRRPETLVLVDPVMADNGTLYAGFSPDFPAGMRELCAKADVIVPNLTEASLLLGEPYQRDGYEKTEIEGLLRRLSALGPEKVVLTGVSFQPGLLGAACYDRSTDAVSFAFREQVDGYYHGTGDVFGSTLLAALLCGRALPDAAAAAVDFTVESILRTKEAGTEPRYGVDFEHGLAGLSQRIERP
jgi:pyridoxine kinase